MTAPVSRAAIHGTAASKNQPNDDERIRDITVSPGIVGFIRSTR